MRKFYFLVGLLLVAFLCTVSDVQARNKKKEVVAEQTTSGSCPVGEMALENFLSCNS